MMVMDLDRFPAKVDVVLLDSSCGDPFHRRSVRVTVARVVEICGKMGILAIVEPAITKNHRLNIQLPELS